MRTIVPLLATLAAAAVALPCGPAKAASPSKTWVSNAGFNNVSCGAITLPCRTFQQAHDNVGAGGEVAVAGPGDYGPVTITKSVSIISDQAGEATAQTGNATGITVQAGTADVVQLRGLTIDGALGTGSTGVNFRFGAALHVRNCAIKNFQGGYGILFQAVVPAELFVSDTAITNNTGTGAVAIYVTPQAAQATVAGLLERVTIAGNNFGIFVTTSSATVNMTVTESLAAGNAFDGIVAVPTGTGPVTLMVERSKLVGNGYGVRSFGASATVLLSNSTVAANTTGLQSAAGGVIGSYGNNNIDRNGTDGAPTTSYALK